MRVALVERLTASQSCAIPWLTLIAGRNGIKLRLFSLDGSRLQLRGEVKSTADALGLAIDLQASFENEGRARIVSVDRIGYGPEGFALAATVAGCDVLGVR